MNNKKKKAVDPATIEHNKISKVHCAPSANHSEPVSQQQKWLTQNSALVQFICLHVAAAAAAVESRVGLANT